MRLKGNAEGSRKSEEEPVEVKPALQVVRRSGSAMNRDNGCLLQHYAPQITDSVFTEFTKRYSLMTQLNQEARLANMYFLHPAG